jgi:hypothetical protein
MVVFAGIGIFLTLTSLSPHCSPPVVVEREFLELSPKWENVIQSRKIEFFMLWLDSMNAKILPLSWQEMEFFWL